MQPFLSVLAWSSRGHKLRDERREHRLTNPIFLETKASTKVHGYKIQIAREQYFSQTLDLLLPFFFFLTNEYIIITNSEHPRGYAVFFQPLPVGGSEEHLHQLQILPPKCPRRGAHTLLSARRAGHLHALRNSNTDNITPLNGAGQQGEQNEYWKLWKVLI